MTTEEQIGALFGEAGRVKSVQMVTGKDGRNVGAAFVELGNQVEVDKAIHLLHGKQYDHQTIEVTQA
jgi:RNA recognition motif-containing protein